MKTFKFTVDDSETTEDHELDASIVKELLDETFAQFNETIIKVEQIYESI